MRFKADESAQAITGKYRQLNPEDNNERQGIHEHVSVPLPADNKATGVPARASPTVRSIKIIASIGASK